MLPHRAFIGLEGFFIIWLAPRAGKMNEIARCDWLPERARWSALARSGLPAVSRKQNFPKGHIINPLLTKFVRSRWLDIGLVLLFASLWTSTSSRSINTQKGTWPISSHLDLTLGQYPIHIIQSVEILHNYHNVPLKNTSRMMTATRNLLSINKVSE